MLNINDRVKLYTDYLDNGGIQKIFFRELCVDLQKVTKLSDGNVDVNTISPIVKAAMLAYEATQMTEPLQSDFHLSEYETLYQKSHFFNQINIDTEHEFNEVFTKYTSTDNILFRGLNEAKYRLYSSLQRFWISNKLVQQEVTYEAFLKDLIENAKDVNLNVLRKHLENSGFDYDNDVAVLSFLQHYSCPTPLLDWTYNFGVSLYFATQNVTLPTKAPEINNYLCVYYLEEEHLEGSSLNHIVQVGLTQQKEHFKQQIVAEFADNGLSSEQIEKICTEEFIELVILKEYGAGTINFMTKVDRLINSPILYFSDAKRDSLIRYCLQNNMNIINQQGVFTWNAHPTKPLENIANAEYQTDDNDYKFSKCINIHKNLVPYIKDKIIKAGITKEFVFPDSYEIANTSFERTTKKIKHL
ncbi:FRG domain-containing protein [Mucilaginibacter lappiensis]|nr:FRG domain-containing protein [Mucilaginibacter lappiensis]SIQ34067.1 FRG domain-containing protein [Mucilaginibacter lappiensis]